MNVIIPMTLLTLLNLGAFEKTGAEEVAESPSGSFSIHQSYGDGWSEEIYFTGSKTTSNLAGFAWPGRYSISPDEHWVLRIQKTGSGDNMAILYQIKENSQVVEVKDFDKKLWAASDKVARLKKAEMRHTGVTKVSWQEGKLTLDLSGLNGDVPDDVFSGSWTFDLKSLSFK